MKPPPDNQPHLNVLYCILDNRFGGPHRLALTVSRKLREAHVETFFLMGYKVGETWQPDDAPWFQLKHIQCIQRRGPLLNLIRFFCFLPYNLFRIRRIIRSNNIGIVHVDGITNFVPALAAALTRTPLVWTYNDYVAPALKRVLMPMVPLLADRIIIQGEKIRERLPQNNPRIDRKVAILHSGVDPQQFLPESFTEGDRQRTRAEFHIPADHKLIATIGNVNFLKGYEYFIEAAARIKGKSPKVKFLIVGRRLDTASQYWGRLQDLVERLGLRDDVIFAGFRADIAPILHALDVFVLSSIVESCPVVVLEAMAMQVPVVATDVGAVSEQIVDGQSGVVVPPRDAGALAAAVLACLDMPREDREAMTNAARRRVETEFSVDRIAYRQRRIYETLGPHGTDPL